MKLADLEGLPLTYAEVGATSGPTLPTGYHHVHVTARIGSGRDRFERAADAVMRYGMLRGAGVRVRATTNVRGFAYGTLPGHAETGEERFAVRYDPGSGSVYSEVVAFSRHATWWSRLGSPAASFVQRVVTKRYLHAV